MRLKVKLPDERTFREVYALLMRQHAQIFSTSERRNLLSTDLLPEGLILQIQSRGGTVSPEYRYDPDAQDSVSCNSF
jgi:hypothetical protein